MIMRNTAIMIKSDARLSELRHFYRRESPTAETGWGNSVYAGGGARNNYDRKETIDGVEVVLTDDWAVRALSPGIRRESTVNVSSIFVKSEPIPSDIHL
jgi:hypothetical protein